MHRYGSVPSTTRRVVVAALNAARTVGSDTDGMMYMVPQMPNASWLKASPCWRNTRSLCEVRQSAQRHCLSAPCTHCVRAFTDLLCILFLDLRDTDHGRQRLIEELTLEKNNLQALFRDETNR